ncbi:hypothetical protein EV193_11524 [Herbihabitans rhizosphaerae]|uniref:MftR C-terminal domain-containing protein n=1 Tax=Herbihabitans rhizosphaerae TaxID=1872711 RepID=A0A4Q7KCV4_9PSEU|nr:hypothetical protein [Herbihabitans rhizosphaerae]RZS31145.1 hypothetical protein EV193_11524 [Herbihabitans rhizosphaerae]
MDQVTARLAERGATPEIAALAAEIGMTCYFAGRTASNNDPRRLLAAIETAVNRLG